VQSLVSVDSSFFKSLSLIVSRKIHSLTLGQKVESIGINIPVVY
jgi:hypothetical protein